MEATICDQPDVFSLSEDREEGEISNDEDDRRNESSWAADRKNAVNFAAMEISGNSTIAGRIVKASRNISTYFNVRLR